MELVKIKLEGVHRAFDLTINKIYFTVHRYSEGIIYIFMPLKKAYDEPSMI